MVTSVCLIACALTLGQAGDRPEWQLAPGLELAYAGSYLEESLIPNVQHQRHYRLETTLLVLGAKAKGWDVAVMTALSEQDARPGADRAGPNPPFQRRAAISR